MHGLPNPQAQNHNAHVSEDTDRNSHPNVQMATVILRHALCSFPTDIHRSVSDGPNKKMQKNVCVYNVRCRFHPPVRRGEPMRAVCDDVRKRDSCVYGMTLSPSLGSGPLCAAALGVAWRGCAFGGF